MGSICGMLKVETSMIMTSFQFNLEEVIESNLKFKGAYHLSELAGRTGAFGNGMRRF